MAPLKVAPDLATALEYGFLYYSAEACPQCQSTVKCLANQACRTCHNPRSTARRQHSQSHRRLREQRERHL
jgi:hypothetical protein